MALRPSRTPEWAAGLVWRRGTRQRADVLTVRRRELVVLAAGTVASGLIPLGDGTLRAHGCGAHRSKRRLVLHKAEPKRGVGQTCLTNGTPTPPLSHRVAAARSGSETDSRRVDAVELHWGTRRRAVASCRVVC